MINFPDSPSNGTVFSLSGITWQFDGVKWLAAGPTTGPTPPDTVNTVTPVTGSTVTLTDFRPVYVNNATVLAALTIKLPPGPLQSSVVEISFRNSVTALTVQNDLGNPVPSAPISAYGPGSALEFRFTSAGWVYWK